MSDPRHKIRLGLVGLGYWGPKLLQKFSRIEAAEVVRFCEKSEDLLRDFAERYPLRYPPTVSFEELISNESYPLDAVIVVTPPETHAALVAQAMLRGLDVFVEKPLATNLQDALYLAKLAREKNRVLMVDHTFCYDHALLYVRNLLSDRKFGTADFQGSAFEWLGARKKPQGPSILWDSGPHAVAAMLFLLKKTPERISMRVVENLSENIPATMTGYAEFTDGHKAEIRLAWQDGVLDGKIVEKAARVAIFGDRRKVLYEGTFGKREVLLHHDWDGAILAPGLTYEDEPLQTVCEEFIRAVAEGGSAFTDGDFGAKVVAILEAAERSCMREGEPIPIVLPQLS
ncbi:MAG: Gfo/Idh/MocA family oxidoreductase [Candidatus Sungiibacteriota bacterium]|uniref:Gfo/Idh/MocA family oxidoreductase n=1 Tax=Candidatus Sungiibacteriota bacterium TaxID=2750080 RepID=A0A7T5UPU4_9BACT|nr:MAG: Gfo/Idh/MocA family oxidoreductase [Candidatus Sungbacteria bacterium]